MEKLGVTVFGDKAENFFRKKEIFIMNMSIYAVGW